MRVAIYGLLNQTIYSGKIKEVVTTCTSLYLSTFGCKSSNNLALVVKRNSV